MAIKQPTTLTDAVEAALEQIGNAGILHIVPELAGVALSEDISLVAILLDPNNMVMQESSLLEFMTDSNLSASGVSGKEWATLEERLSRAELRHTSLDFSTGVSVNTVNNKTKIIPVDGPSVERMMIDGSSEYLPLVGLALGKQNGPIKDALDNILLSRIHRSRNRTDLCTSFLRNLLKLWKEVLAYWIDHESDYDQNHIASTVPGWLNRHKGKKRARSTEPEEEHPPAKRVAQASRSSSDFVSSSTQQRVASSTYSHASMTPATPATWPPNVLAQLVGLSNTAFPPSSGLDIMETFNRREFSKRFGGATGGVYSAWNKGRRMQNFSLGVGQNDIIAIYTAYQPFGPSHPCSHGLLLEFQGANDYKRSITESGASDRRLYTVIMQCQKAWRYCGEYQISSTGHTIRWEDLPHINQRTWVDRTYADRDKDGYKDILKTQVASVTSKDSIARAFANGHITLRTLVLECVEYHEEIQRAIISMNKDTSTDHLVITQVEDDDYLQL